MFSTTEKDDELTNTSQRLIEALRDSCDNDNVQYMGKATTVWCIVSGMTVHLGSCYAMHASISSWLTLKRDTFPCHVLVSPNTSSNTFFVVICLVAC